jgi:hypothetical protein
MKPYKFFILLFAGIIFIFLIYIGLLSWAFPSKQEYASLYVYPDYYVDTSILEDISWNVSNSNIYSEQYDCTQFSRELVKQLRADNYSARCIYGAYYNGSQIFSHTWVEVKIGTEIIPIEAVRGYIIGKGEYYAHYQTAFKGFCL